MSVENLTIFTDLRDEKIIEELRENYEKSTQKSLTNHKLQRIGTYAKAPNRANTVVVRDERSTENHA